MKIYSLNYYATHKVRIFFCLNHDGHHGGTILSINCLIRIILSNVGYTILSFLGFRKGLAWKKKILHMLSYLVNKLKPKYRIDY